MIQGCTYVAVLSSPDGVHFSKHSTEPVYGGSDTQNNALWDKRSNQYLVYRRLHLNGPRGHQFDRDRFHRQCWSCVARTRQANSGVVSDCGYECSGANCSGCGGSAHVRCRADTDCSHIKVWYTKDSQWEKPKLNGLCQADAARAKCVDGLCSSVSQPLCVADSGGPSCGLSYSSNRAVGLCAGTSLASKLETCKGDGSKPAEEYEVVIAGDMHDSPCVDMYNSMVVEYEGHFLAFPSRLWHMPLPPAWGEYANGTSQWAYQDGTLDTPLLHSRDGKNFSYVGGDRSSFFGLGAQGGPPAPSNVATPGASEAATWRESMAVVLRGYVVRKDRIYMYGYGGRNRHNQDLSTTADGGGGMVRRLSLRVDGFASVGDMHKRHDLPGRFITHPFVMQGRRLLVNAVVGNGGGIAVGVMTYNATSGRATPVEGLSTQTCVTETGDLLYEAVGWSGHGTDLSALGLSGVPIQLEFELRLTELYGYQFKSDDAAASAVARTPPLGFNTWNSFGCAGLNAKVLVETADALVSTGLRDVGFNFVNTDDCWMSNDRAANGSQIANEAKFPGGLGPVIAHIHSRGLLFGLYTAMGNTTCAKHAASCMHEAVDAQTYANWKVDYVKDDKCGMCTGGTLGSYSRMARALNATGRPIVLSIEGDPPIETVSKGGFGNLRRVGHDIQPNWQSVMSEVDTAAGLHPYAHPGFFNDLDVSIAALFVCFSTV